MARYKVLKSVAHNLGHSFLSDMNGVPDRHNRWVFVSQQIYEVAREHGAPRVAIDFLRGSVTPEVFATREVEKAVNGYRASLGDQVTSQGGSVDMVRAVTLELCFDLSRVQHDRYTPERDLPAFTCRVEILDDRGVVHVGEPRNWWTTRGGPLEAEVLEG